MEIIAIVLAIITIILTGSILYFSYNSNDLKSSIDDQAKSCKAYMEAAISGPAGKDGADGKNGKDAPTTAVLNTDIVAQYASTLAMYDVVTNDLEQPSTASTTELQNLKDGVSKAQLQILAMAWTQEASDAVKSLITAVEAASSVAVVTAKNAMFATSKTTLTTALIAMLPSIKAKVSSGNSGN